MKKTENIKYGEHPLQVLDLWLPDKIEKGKTPVFVYFHGGGLEKGSKGNVSALCEYLTEHGVAVADANYRMYPEFDYKNAICDAASAVAYIKEKSEELGGFGRIYVDGSSAGGYISMMLCFDESYLGAHGIEPHTLGGYIHDAGQPTAHFNALKYAGIDPRRVIVDESAPLWHIGRANEYAPMLFIVSDGDMENRYEQTMLVLSTLKHFRYDESRIHHRVMHGSHCHYVRQRDEQGESVFGKLCLELIKV